MSSLPNLSLLSLDNRDNRWLRAVGTRPRFKSWKSLRGTDKHRLLHGVADAADRDDEADGDYVTAYEMKDIDDVLAASTYSVEHVVPRSVLNGREPAAGENDPIGWIEATRKANSKRSNYPLVLWQDGPNGQLMLPRSLVRIDGVKHFVPPFEQRARLARKWMFIRATYADEVEAPTVAQSNRRNEIVALAKHYPIQPAERRVNEHYRRTLGWANPLLEDNAEQFYDDAAWRGRVFGVSGVSRNTRGRASVGAPGDADDDPILLSAPTTEAETSSEEEDDGQANQNQAQPQPQPPVEIPDAAEVLPSPAPSPRASQSRDGEAEPPSSSSSVEVVDYQASDLRAALQVKESGVINGEPGLFAAADIPANSLVTVYTYDRVVDQATLNVMSDSKLDAINRFAMEGATKDLTLILNIPVNSKHVGAFANEPSKGTNQSSNMSLHSEKVSLPNGDTWHVVALYTCDAPVRAGEELLWNYGKNYAPTRKKEGYEASKGCTSLEPLNPPIEEVVARILSTRGEDEGDLEGILYKMDPEFSSDDDSDDEPFRPGRTRPQKTRTLPQRARKQRMQL